MIPVFAHDFVELFFNFSCRVRKTLYFDHKSTLKRHKLIVDVFVSFDFC